MLNAALPDVMGGTARRMPEDSARDGINRTGWLAGCVCTVFGGRLLFLAQVIAATSCFQEVISVSPKWGGPLHINDLDRVVIACLALVTWRRSGTLRVARRWMFLSLATFNPPPG
jgi:hypothetical protein